MSDGRWEVPSTWAWAKLGDIADIVGGGTPASKVEKNFSSTGIPWITPADLTEHEGAYISRGGRGLTNKGYSSCGARMLPAGAVLFSSRAPIGYCVIAANPLSTSQGFKSLVLRGGMVPEFVRYYLLSSTEYAKSLATGTTFLELSSSRMAELRVPVPSIAQQKQIVEKLDRLTGRLSLAAQELDSIGTLLKTYREALLGMAYEGALLGNLRPNKIKLGAITKSLRYGTAKKSHANAAGTPVLRIPNVANGAVVLDDLKFTVLEERDYEKLRLEKTDLLIVRSNGSPELIGRPAVVGEQAEGMAYAGYLIRLRPDLEKVEPRFLSYMLQAPQIRSRIVSSARSTSGVHNINTQELAALPIPEFSLSQQAELVSRLDRVSRWVERIRKETVVASRQIDRLTSALLSKAFRGGLSAQSDKTRSSGQALLQSIDASERYLNALAPPKLAKEELMDDQDPMDILLQDIESWPNSGVTFPELSKRVPIAYEVMREKLFLLLGGARAVEQVFDSSAECIRFRRVSK